MISVELYFIFKILFIGPTGHASRVLYQPFTYYIWTKYATGCWVTRVLTQQVLHIFSTNFLHMDYRKINPTWSSSKDTPPWSSERRRRAEVICRKFAWLLTTTPQSQTADQLARLWTQDQFRGPKFQPWSVWETDRLFDSRFLDTASRHWRKGSKQWEGSFCCPCGVLILLVKRPMIF